MPESMRCHTSRAALRAAPLLLLGVAACDDSATEVRTFPVEVEVSFPANYAAERAADARVVLTNTTRGTADTAFTGPDGRATFARVLPGSYAVSASRALTPAEVQQLTGAALPAGQASLALAASIPAQALTAAPAGPLAMRLAGSPVGALVIRQLYYTGSRTPANGTYFADQFLELYNNSTDTLYLDSLAVGEVFGVSGQINPSDVPTPFQSDQAHVYLRSAWMIPGTGRERALPPGRSVVIAQDAINHRDDPNGNPNSPVNLGDADWETFNERQDGRDADSPSAPNLVKLRHDTRFDWNVPVFGPALVLFRAAGFAQLDSAQVPGAATTAPYYVRLPVAQVVDAVDALQNAQSAAYKRIPTALDAGFTFTGDTYTSKAVRRKVAATIGGRRVLVDTNDSGNDFEVVTPPAPRGF